MIELETPQIEPVAEAGTYAKYEAGPLQAGYGVTLGNALRRVLLSSLEGAAVTSIQIRDVYQEFSTIPGVKEDVTQIVLNVKKLRLKSFASHPVQLRLIKSGAGPVIAADIAESADVEIVNPELVLMTIDSDDVTIEMDLTVERGVGYLAAERSEALPIGVIAVDAIFTPVRKVNYWVESMRVGQMTNFDKLTIEIETDGTITPEEALSRSADTLVRQFQLLFEMNGKHLEFTQGGLEQIAVPEDEVAVLAGRQAAVVVVDAPDTRGVGGQRAQRRGARQAVRHGDARHLAQRRAGVVRARDRRQREGDRDAGAVQQGRVVKPRTHLVEGRGVVGRRVEHDGDPGRRERRRDAPCLGAADHHDADAHVGREPQGLADVGLARGADGQRDAAREHRLQRLGIQMVEQLVARRARRAPAPERARLVERVAQQHPLRAARTARA